MVEKCANPACPAKFRRLRDGRVFVKEVEVEPTNNAGQHSRQLSYYWLCGACCRTMTVLTDQGRGIRVVPLPNAPASRAAS